MPSCPDGFCGADDCSRCRPNHRNADALGDPPELFVLEVLPEYRPGRGRYWRTDRKGYTDDVREAGVWGADALPRSDRAEPVPLSLLMPAAREVTP